MKNSNIIKYYKYNDGTARTVSANNGLYAMPTAPTIEGYTFLGCVGGQGENSLGLVVQPNGWVFNSLNSQISITSITWYFLYIKKY